MGWDVRLGPALEHHLLQQGAVVLVNVLHHDLGLSLHHNLSGDHSGLVHLGVKIFEVLPEIELLGTH